MLHQLIITEDGSHSIYVPSMDVRFHSKYGAIQESMHMFIDAGLRIFMQRQTHIRIFEMGFGTGLNALLSVLSAEKEKNRIEYVAIDAFPLEKNIQEEINYCGLLNRPDMQPVFKKMHDAAWENEVDITPYFTLKKIKADFIRYATTDRFDIIYYDAFDPGSQPALWRLSIFKKVFEMLVPGGCLLTYCSKGSVRRTMQEAGFVVEKLPGPKGKREIVRANVRI